MNTYRRNTRRLNTLRKVCLFTGRTARCQWVSTWLYRSIRAVKVSAVIFPAVIFCVSLVPFSYLQADQRDPRLPTLFDELQAAPSATAANDIETIIWSLWLETEDTHATALLASVVSAMSNRDLDEALIASNALVEYAPKFAEAWNKRATVHYLMGNYNASVEDIQRTVQLEPRHFGAISGLGLIFFQRGNLSAALQAFEQVLLISPQSVNARRSADQVRGQLGEEI